MLTPLTHSALTVPHGFFTRQGGVSEGIYASLNCGPGSADDPAHVAENRARVAQYFSLAPAQLCTLYQIHSAEVLTVTVENPSPLAGEARRGGVQKEKNVASGTPPHPSPLPQGERELITAPFPAKRPQADAMVTNLPGLALGILTADCGPVLFADAKNHVIGAAHAGWKGAYHGILENTVAAMEALGAERAQITAVLGPTIAQNSYEVGPEFVERFAPSDQAHFFVRSSRAGYHRFHLPAYILARLAALGLASTHDLAMDTCSNEAQFFSYRRSTLRKEPDYGRQVSVIALT